jgi:hypothetical protein
MQIPDEKKEKPQIKPRKNAQSINNLRDIQKPAFK